MTKSPVILGSLALVCVLSRPASAAVCVEVDASRDNLPEADRNALKTLLAGTLAQQGQEVGTQNCAGTFVVYHVRLGQSVNIVLQGPPGYRQATARVIEEVPVVYNQMVRSLLTGQPMNGANDTVDRTNATAQQAAPRRVNADKLWYVRLGYGSTVGPAMNNGPAFGFGYRYELDSLGIDFSFLNFMVDGDDDSSGGSSGLNGSLFKLMGLYYLNPTANRSTYLGGGLSWGGTALEVDSSYYSDSGLQAELSLGYELLRASTIRMFLQADATLPLYFVDRNSFDPGVTKDKAYAATFTVAFGIGWGSSSVKYVSVVP